MNRILMLMAVAALMVAMIVVSAVPALAQGHRHILTTPSGNQNEIGVPICDVPQIPLDPFNTFHSVIHEKPNDVRAAPC
jgi:hypothetical protein